MISTTGSFGISVISFTSRFKIVEMKSFNATLDYSVSAANIALNEESQRGLSNAVGDGRSVEILAIKTSFWLSTFVHLFIGTISAYSATQREIFERKMPLLWRPELYAGSSSFLYAVYQHCGFLFFSAVLIPAFFIYSPYKILLEFGENGDFFFKNLTFF